LSSSIETTMNWEQYLLDMEVETGTKVLSLPLVKKTLDCFSYGHPHRLYILLLFAGGLRVGEPCELHWDNFVWETNMLIFRPQNQKGKVLRRVKLPIKFMEELKHYRDHNFFPGGKCFPMGKKSYCRYFNKKYRQVLPAEWQQYHEVKRRGSVAQFHTYTLRGLRATHATIAYFYYSMVYGHGDLAVKKTAKHMGHSSSYMTSEYYIQRISDLQLKKYALMPMLKLLDHVIYGETQVHLNQWQERQSNFLEYETGAQMPNHYRKMHYKGEVVKTF